MEPAVLELVGGGVVVVDVYCNGGAGICVTGIGDHLYEIILAGAFLGEEEGVGGGVGGGGGGGLGTFLRFVLGVVGLLDRSIYPVPFLLVALRIYNTYLDVLAAARGREYRRLEGSLRACRPDWYRPRGPLDARVVE